ncbi:MAG: isoprenylcysteine carboxylmethyltransferase family protein [Thiotrichaceae bacterium]|nr:isoprenylcysteine carboxylmethyltransferase family protein [Thiotrichaceae bacterium]
MSVAPHTLPQTQIFYNKLNMLNLKNIFKKVTTTPSGIIALPPVLYLSAFCMGGMIHLIYPQSILPFNGILQYLGIFLLIVSATLAGWAFISLRNLGTSPDPRKHSLMLSTQGAFGFSRNPIYVAMTGLYLGMTLIINSLWLLLLLMPLLWLMHWGVVLREERYLLNLFGESYIQYQATVRRWL